jgi:hypothetical protein
MTAFTERFPTLAGLLMTFRQIYHDGKAIRSEPGYREVHPDPLDHAPLEDASTAYFLRCLMEGGYRTAIEMGAFRGEKIRSIKRLLPSLDAWAIDIVPSYDEPFEADGVKFRSHNPDFFENSLPQALAFCRGTLTHMTETQLRDCIAAFREKNIDLLFYEPCPMFSVRRSFKRHPGAVAEMLTWYHPYARYLEEAGYEVPTDGTGTKHLHGVIFRQEGYRLFHGRLPKEN